MSVSQPHSLSPAGNGWCASRSRAEPQSRAQGRTHVQRLEAVPAEGVFAVLAHHLGTPFVPLDVDLALGAALDGGLILLQSERGAAGESRSAPGSAGLGGAVRTS